MKALHFGLSLFSILLLVSCKHEPFEPEPVIEDKLAFTFLAHTRMGEEAEINPQLSLNDWTAEGALLLGGDLDLLTSRSPTTLAAYDNIFDFSSPRTLWSLGNHDYSELDDVLDLTQRNSFYAYQTGGSVVFVTDSQGDKGSLLAEQLELFQTVTDTLVNAKTFILLSHKLIWMPGHPELEEIINVTANGPFNNCDFCTGPNNFYEDIYPTLKILAESDIQVICLAGDMGHKKKNFQFTTADGIQYIGNGWNLDDPNNSYLKFYESEGDSLRWEIVNIE